MELHVVVHYPAADEPFKDKDAKRSETVGHLKARVLTAFGLTEGQGPDNTVVSHERRPSRPPSFHHTPSQRHSGRRGGS